MHIKLIETSIYGDCRCHLEELLREAYNLGARKMNDSAAKAVENMQADWADNDRNTNAYAFATKEIQEIRALLPPGDNM